MVRGHRLINPRSLVREPIPSGAHLDDHCIAVLIEPSYSVGNIYRVTTLCYVGQGSTWKADGRVRVGRDGDIETELPIL